MHRQTLAFIPNFYPFACARFFQGRKWVCFTTERTYANRKLAALYASRRPAWYPWGYIFVIYFENQLKFFFGFVLLSISNSLSCKMFVPDHYQWDLNWCGFTSPHCILHLIGFLTPLIITLNSMSCCYVENHLCRRYNCPVVCYKKFFQKWGWVWLWLNHCWNHLKLFSCHICFVVRWIEL